MPCQLMVASYSPNIEFVGVGSGLKIMSDHSCHLSHSVFAPRRTSQTRLHTKAILAAFVSHEHFLRRPLFVPLPPSDFVSCIRNCSHNHLKWPWERVWEGWERLETPQYHKVNFSLGQFSPLSSPIPQDFCSSFLL